ncbi:MAG: HNH endonuclease signature motif containing protein, partial [Actinomycetes bacterium]
VPPSLRRLLEIRDGGCAFPGCDRPPRWSQAHHIEHWCDGGFTSSDNCVLLCAVHHRRVHHHGWEVRVGADRLPEFLPPAWIDPERRPRRNVRARTVGRPRRSSFERQIATVTPILRT